MLSFIYLTNLIMKKIINMVFMLLLCFYFIVQFKTESCNDFKENYETWNTDMPINELEQYYFDNKIGPTSINEETGKMLNKTSVSEHLSKLNPNYEKWSVKEEHYVNDVYKSNPKEIYENNKFIQEAKKSAGIDYNYIGCGPLALFCQFLYLSESAGYLSIANNVENGSDESLSLAPNYVKLAEEIFKETKTISSDSKIGEIFAKEDGTLTFPSSAISSAKNILIKNKMMIPKTREKVKDDGSVYKETYYDNDSQLLVYGDSIPNLSSFNTKITNLKDSIDKGMPVIWWTMGENKAQDFSNHFMNIYGYEYWTSTDSFGNTKTHLMFILRYNWGINDVYMDSDVLKAVNGGVIFFEENHEKTVIKPENYELDNQYFYDVKEKKDILPYMGNTFSIEYLRTGYVNRYDNTNTFIKDRQISLSANRANAGNAYVHYKLKKPICNLYIELSMWSYSEGISKENGYMLIQYKTFDGEWKNKIDLLNDILISTRIDDKSKIHCSFDDNITEFKINVISNNPTTSRNKGRIVIGNIIISHDEFKELHRYSYVSCGKDGHRVICSCGETFIRPHSVNKSDTSNRYANCVECGETLDMNRDYAIVQFKMNKLLYVKKNDFIIDSN